LAHLDAAAAEAARPALPCSNETVSHDSNSNTTSQSTSGNIEQCRWDTAQQLARVNNVWRVMTQLRSQLAVAILEPWQAAQIAVSTYPYMLLGGTLYKHLEPEQVLLPCASSTTVQVATAAAVAAYDGAVMLEAGSGHATTATVFLSRDVLLGGSVVGDNFTGVQAV
jgi:hypothetical protein